MKLPSLRDRRNCLLLSALLALFYLPAIQAWARGGWAFGEDAPGLFAPWRAFAAAEIWAGRWPLWNPWLFGGLPFALNGQAALGYPPNLIFWLLPFKTALLLDAVAHSILLGLGAYFLGRALGLSRTASCLLGLCLGANGAVSAHVYAGHVTWHAARAWLPWMLWALVLGLRTRRVRYAYALAVFCGLQFAAGYPPLALAGAGLCATSFIAYFALSILAPGAAPAGPNSVREWARANLWALRWGSIAGGLGLGLVASLALPLREVSGLSVHGSGLPWSEASELSGSWKSFVRWIVPGLFNHARPLQWSIHYGAHEEASAIGILPTILALGAPWWAGKMATRRQVLVLRGLWCAMLGCALMALGLNTPLYHLLFEHVGLFRVLRFPVRWLEVWATLASIAAALVFDIWYRCAKAAHASPARSEAQGKYLQRRLLALSVVALALGLCILGAAWWLSSRSLQEFWRPLLLSRDPLWPAASRPRFALMLRRVALSECLIAASWCTLSALLALGARWCLGACWRNGPSRRAKQSSSSRRGLGARQVLAEQPRAELIRAPNRAALQLQESEEDVEGAIASGAVEPLAPGSSRAWAMLLWKLALVLVACELGSLFSRSQRTWVELPPNQARPSIPPELSVLYVPGERWVTSVEWRAINGGMASGVEIFNGYDAMNTRAFWSLAQASEGRARWVDMFQPSRLSPALRIAGVTHALFHSHLPLRPPPGARLEASVREWRLWRIADAREVWPRLFLTRRIQRAPEPDLVPALESLARTPAPAPGQDWPLLLVGSAGSRGDASTSTWARGDGEDGGGSSGRVLSWRSRPNVLECRVEALQPCWLGISQAWAPSWRAWVNGRPVPLSRANGPFCALPLPRGKSQVRLVYEPQTWRCSSFVGLCALALLSAGAGAFLSRRGAAAST